MSQESNTIWTIGHSTRSAEEFIEILQSFSIEVLGDIRTFPGSKRYPHFNKENLEKMLPAAGIAYIHFAGLGGRRKPLKNSENTAWRNESFRGYADYMLTRDFQDAVDALEKTGREKRTAFMCSEAVWWSCHRSLVADHLKWKHWIVMHISAAGKSVEHPYTSAARFTDGVLHYRENELF